MSTNYKKPISPSDWISQAEAAQLRGVSRQAISKLVRKGRLKSIVIGGHTFVHRADVQSFRPRAAGRPQIRSREMTDIKQIEHLLSLCSPEERQKVFRYLRKEFSIHPLEAELNTDAEIILEAIQRSGGLTLRMIRGVIAEAAFEIDVVERLEGWSNIAPPGDLPYDFLLDDGKGTVRVQVKLQRSVENRPMKANEAYRFLPADMYVVETQRTRRGSTKTGGSTRLYRFGEFDLLAVSMQPSTNRWNTFMYTVADWLLPGRTDPSEILRFQPVATTSNDDWTDEFHTVVEWFRSGSKKKICGEK